MKVFVVVVTYNGVQWIEKCFSSLFASSIPVEVIVIDNNSTDTTRQIITSNFPNIDLIESKENLGFGRANNLGIKKALEEGAEHVFLLNQDAWVDENTIEELAKAQKGNSEFGVISPVHLNGDGDLLDFKFYDYITGPGNRGVYSAILKATENKLFELPFINAAAWMVSRACFEKIGGFDPLFSHYGEDVNYIHRLHYHKLKLGLLTSVNIYHDREPATIQKKIKSVDRVVVDYMAKCCDPSGVFALQLKNQKKNIRGKLIRSILKRDVDRLKFYIKVNSRLSNNEKRMKESLMKNRKEGLHYLD